LNLLGTVCFKSLDLIWVLLSGAEKEKLSSTEKVVQKIRVLVANRPRLMKDLVLATIGDQPDIEVVGETEDEAEITELVERTRPDYLIIALENPEARPGLSGFLLGRYPEMKILALAAERNSGIFYWAFVDIRSRLVESSEQGILSVLRNKAALVEI
jgi:hypothetical protein